MSGLLGQVVPPANTWTDLFTVPVNTVTTMRVIVTNRNGADATFRVAASKDGDAIEDKHWLAGNKPIAGDDTGATIGFVVSSGDIVRVYASNTNLSFTATGETRPE